ncbi:hypothetical protein ATCC90586_010906 [Pythium insidiosum]|nr:hypothetical protein ATCC90586_010906 [Pythium insidiosum]
MVKYAVITGTPGIGKSVFVYYVMWKLIKDKKRVLLMTEEPAIYFDGLTIWECRQKHEIKAGAADDLARLGAKGNRLYFLLPPLYFQSFTKKTPQTIQQFALLIPYPEVV